jgi:WD40 repeat protein
LKFSPDGKWLATAEDDGRMQLWDTKTQRPVRVLPGPTQLVRGVCFAHDSKTVAACCDDGNIYIWDVQTGRLRATLAARPNFLQSLAFSSDGKTLVTCGVTFKSGEPTENQLSVWDVTQKKVRIHISSEGVLSAGGTGLAFAPGSNHFAAAYSEGFRGVKVWDATTGQEVERFVYDTGFPLAVAFSPDGKWLASGGGDTRSIQPNVREIIGRLKVWDRTTGKLHKTLVERSEGYFRDIVFSRDSKFLYSGSQGPFRKVMINGKQDGSKMCTCSQVHCWDTERWNRLWTSEGDYGELWSLDLSPDGRTVAASDGWGTRLLDAASGQWVRKLIAVGD